MLFSPSSISMFLTCPAKFWYYKKGYKPLEIKKELFDFGKKLHQAIALYYKAIPPNITAKEVDIYIINALQRVTNLPYRKLSENVKFKRFIKYFSQFEKQRIKQITVKPLYVEKEYVREPFKGVIDAIFTDLNGNLIVVDWKTSLKSHLPDEYKIQGCIYGLLTEASEVIFYSLLTGKTIKITRKDCLEVKEKIAKAIKDIKNGVNRKIKSKHCKDCEYQLICSMDERKSTLKIYEGVLI